MIKVLIVDDHAIVRKGLRHIAEESKQMEVGEAGEGNEALSKIRAERWDVIVLDINLPGRNGLDVLQAVRDLHPKMPVLVLSSHPEEQYAVRVLRAGASGFMNKDAAPDQLVAAILKVMGGGKYISPMLAEQLAFELSENNDRPPHEKLSAREYRVLIMIGEGKAVGEIATELLLSVKTVSTYRARILEKLNLQNNAQLMRYVVDHKLS